MTDWQIIAVLLAALALLWLSTRQIAFSLRAIIWLAGAGAFAAAAWFFFERASESGELTLLNAALDGEIGLMSAIGANWAVVDDAVAPLLVGFLAAGAVLGLLALIALTPGETIERLTRPLIMLFIGVILGGLFALAAVAVGFGGYLKPRTYVFAAQEAVIGDGDTFSVGDVSFRLDGIDAPEADQICIRPDGERWPCGQDMRGVLENMMRDGIVLCERRDGVSDLPPRESYGRPIVACSVRREGAVDLDIATQMVLRGAAVGYNEDDFVEEQREAREDQRGLWAACTLNPQTWRHNAPARAVFIAQAQPPQGAGVIGCEAGS